MPLRFSGISNGKDRIGDEAGDAALVVVIVVVAVVIVVGLTLFGFMQDGTAPVVSGSNIKADPGCRKVTFTIDITVTDPTNWYQDDSGIAEVTVDGATHKVVGTDVFTYSVTSFATKTDCASTISVTVSAKDHTGNASTSTLTFPGVPVPYCCDSREAKEHNCDCYGFDAHH